MAKGRGELSLVVTCEHGGSEVPAAYRKWFVDAKSVLQSHRGYDPGALEFAQRLAQACQTKPHTATITRLLVELNRSRGHSQLFSRYVASLTDAERNQVLRTYYEPYRKRVTQDIRRRIERGMTVCHLSVHSFTPVLDGVVRRADIGLLYDPQRAGERSFCLAWQRALRKAAPSWVVRRNYPYQGKADGFTTALRKQFPDSVYRGIELEMNQRWPQQSRATWRAVQRTLIETLRATLQAAAAARH